MKKLLIALLALLTASCSTIQPMNSFSTLTNCVVDGCANSVIHHHVFLE
jgi:hypothetical protein